nr:hypothetical protein [Lachnoclostridium phytofermentans]
MKFVLLRTNRNKLKIKFSACNCVVTEHIPDNSIAVGNPCRVIRQITEEDRKYYFKNREFDVEDY